MQWGIYALAEGRNWIAPHWSGLKSSLLAELFKENIPIDWLRSAYLLPLEMPRFAAWLHGEGLYLDEQIETSDSGHENIPAYVCGLAAQNVFSLSAYCTDVNLDWEAYACLLLQGVDCEDSGSNLRGVGLRQWDVPSKNGASLP